MRISVGGILAAFVIYIIGPAQTQVPPGETEYAAYKGLHLAAASGDVAEIRRLAADKKQLNARDSCGRTPLMVAAYKS